MDKAIFLFDKSKYTNKQVEELTWKDCEKWVAEEDYENDYDILKIDANGYKSVVEALIEEGLDNYENDYIVKSFGF